MYLSQQRIQTILKESGFDVGVKYIRQVDSGFDKTKYASAYLVDYFKEGGSTLSNIFCFYYHRNGDIAAELS